MTKYKLADLDKWATKTIQRMDAIVAQSTNDAIVMSSKTATGKTRGGSLKRGFVPKNEGILAASLVSTLTGSTAITQGNGDFSLVVAAMKAGDYAEFLWTADYARPMHYGYKGNEGWHWVTEMVAMWQDIVTGNVVKAKALYP